MTMAEIISIIDEASTFHVEVPNILDGGIGSRYRERERTRAVLNCGLHKGSPRDVARQRNHIAQQLDVRIGEADLHSSFVTTGLLRSAAGKYSDGGGAETFKNILNSSSKTLSVGKKKDYRGDAPSHAQHGEHGLA